MNILLYWAQESRSPVIYIEKNSKSWNRDIYTAWIFFNLGCLENRELERSPSIQKTCTILVGMIIKCHLIIIL